MLISDALFPDLHKIMSSFQGQAMDVDSVTAAEMDQKSAARSCTTCSKAKAKCVRRPGHEICERCSRLRKECHSREPTLRRRKVIKTTRAAQLEKLESKIEHLVNTLSVNQARRTFSADYGQPSPPISHSSAERSTERSSNHRETTEVLNALCEGPEDLDDGLTPTSASTSTPNAASGYSMSQVASPDAKADCQSFGVSISEAEMLLDRYRRLMAYAMPFVLLPSQTTVQSLLATKPLLLHSILTVAYFHDLPKQQVMLKRLLRDISERVLINCEKSLDVLQGILILVAWYYPHTFTTNQSTNLLHLAQALATDMGIDRAPFACPDWKTAATKGVNGAPQPPRPAAMEEHRALAGLYFQSSILASSFKKIEGMKYSRFLDDALNTLERAHEYDSDLFLVQTVRLQHLVDEAATTEPTTAPLQMYVKAFNVDLERLRNNDPCAESNNILLELQYIAAEITIWELSLTDLQDNNAKPLRSHLDDLCRCVKTTKTFIDKYFTIPTSLYLTLPFSVFGQFGHTFFVLIKLASLEVDGWDMRDLNEQFSFVEVIEDIATRFESSAKFGPDGMTLNNESFSKWAVRIRWMKQVYDSKFVKDGEKAENRTEATSAMFTKPSTPAVGYDHPTPVMQQPTPPDDMLSGDFFNYLDENFWQSFAGDFDLGFPEINMAMA